ncbi:MAG: DUF5050 domain-containing protein, partial [Oscillospiraceae bacterium]|nr:DUF5050 domain-containing protein [Oscillospiraceae bacterium]
GAGGTGAGGGAGGTGAGNETGGMGGVGGTGGANATSGANITGDESGQVRSETGGSGSDGPDGAQSGREAYEESEYNYEAFARNDDNSEHVENSGSMENSNGAGDTGSAGSSESAGIPGGAEHNGTDINEMSGGPGENGGSRALGVPDESDGLGGLGGLDAAGRFGDRRGFSRYAANTGYGRYAGYVGIPLNTALTEGDFGLKYLTGNKIRSLTYMGDGDILFSEGHDGDRDESIIFRYRAQSGVVEPMYGNMTGEENIVFANKGNVLTSNGLEVMLYSGDQISVLKDNGLHVLLGISRAVEYDGRLYFASQAGFFSANTDMDSVSFICDDGPQSQEKYEISGGKIFYIYRRPDQAGYLYMMDIDGDNKIKLLSEPVCDFDIDGYDLYYINAVNGYIYRLDASTGQKEEVVFEKPADSIICADGYLVFRSLGDKFSIHAININDQSRGRSARNTAGATAGTAIGAEAEAAAAGATAGTAIGAETEAAAAGATAGAAIGATAGATTASGIITEADDGSAAGETGYRDINIGVNADDTDTNSRGSANSEGHDRVGEIGNRGIIIEGADINGGDYGKPENDTAGVIDSNIIRLTEDGAEGIFYYSGEIYYCDWKDDMALYKVRIVNGEKTKIFLTR